MVCYIGVAQTADIILRFVEPWECMAAMDAILKGTQVSRVSCIMHESIYSVFQARSHLHFNRVTDGHCRFDSNMKQNLTCLW